MTFLPGRRSWGSRTTPVLLTAAGLILSGCGSTESAPEGSSDAASLFAGKTVRLVITHSAGGGTDLYARFIGDRLSEFIPGKPRIQVSNMDGIGGVNTVFNAPADQIIVGVSSRGATLMEAAADAEGDVDLEQIRFVGATGGDPRGWTGFTDVSEAYDTLADASGSSGPAFKLPSTVGSPAQVTSHVLMYSWLCDRMDLPCEYINVANDDATDTNLMIQRGETNLEASTLVTSLRSYSEQLLANEAKVFLTYTLDPATTITAPGIEMPAPEDVIPSELMEEFDMIEPIIGGGPGKGMWVGPATSHEVLTALQAAYSDLVNDPALVDELAQAIAGEDADADSSIEYVVSPISGEEAQTSFSDAVAKVEESGDFIEELQNQYWKEDWS